MHAFKDATGANWTIEINVAAVKKCRALLNVDLYGLLDEKLGKLTELLGDPVQLVDVLYVLCEAQAKERNVSDEDFGRRMRGDAIGEAADKFVEELIDFFPEPKARQSLRNVMGKGKKIGTLLIERAEKMVDEINPDSEAEKLIGLLMKQPVSSA